MDSTHQIILHSRTTMYHNFKKFTYTNIINTSNSHTLSSSLRLVTMTIVGTFNSQIIRQKSANVAGIGP